MRFESKFSLLDSAKIGQILENLLKSLCFFYRIQVFDDRKECAFDVFFQGIIEPFDRDGDRIPGSSPDVLVDHGQQGCQSETESAGGLSVSRAELLMTA